MYSFDYITRRIRPMRAYELIKETFLRKGFIRTVHISWLAIYGLLFLIPLPRGAWQAWPWGLMLFYWSGCTLPLLISAGIIGDDIASGRISLIVTKPLWLGELYIYRFAGLSLQALVHLVIAGSMIFVLRTIVAGNAEDLDRWIAEFKNMGMIQNRSNIEHFGLWILSTWLIFNCWAALSTTLSTIVKRAQNSIVLFASTGFVYFFVVITMQLFPKHIITKTTTAFIRYACPPVELLFNLANGKFSLMRSFSCVMHSVLLIAIYGIIGIIVLSTRQFECARD